MRLSKVQLAQMIDHTNVKPTATEEDVIRLCRDAIANGFGNIYVNPCYLPLAARELAGSSVKLGAAIGFPLGANTPEVKRFEVEQAIARGAQIADVVINVGELRSGNTAAVEEDLRQVVDAAEAHEVPVRVILECCYLTDEQKTTACAIAEKVGAGFVKTSTGLGPGGATVADVRLMRKAVGNRLQIKAAGGIKTLADVVALLEAGANRLGTSAGVNILKQVPEDGLEVNL